MAVYRNDLTAYDDLGYVLFKYLSHIEDISTLHPDLGEYVKNKDSKLYKQITEELLRTWYERYHNATHCDFYNKAVSFRNEFLKRYKDMILNIIKEELKKKDIVLVDLSYVLGDIWSQLYISVDDTGISIKSDITDLLLEVLDKYPELKKQIRALDIAFREFSMLSEIRSSLIAAIEHGHGIKPKEILPKPEYKWTIDVKYLAKYEQEKKEKILNKCSPDKPEVAASMSASFVNFWFSNLLQDLIKEGYSCTANDFYYNIKQEDEKVIVELSIDFRCRTEGQQKQVRVDYEIELYK